MQKATSEVMRGKISCASHNTEQMSAAAAAKTADIAALKAHLQQDVVKQEYISVLKARVVKLMHHLLVLHVSSDLRVLMCGNHSYTLLHTCYEAQVCWIAVNSFISRMCQAVLSA